MKLAGEAEGAANRLSSPAVSAPRETSARRKSRQDETYAIRTENRIGAVDLMNGVYGRHSCLQFYLRAGRRDLCVRRLFRQRSECT